MNLKEVGCEDVSKLEQEQEQTTASCEHGVELVRFLKAGHFLLT
jgi:hypothetical protein